MSWLPRSTVLGHLDISEVFIDYDGPRLFACRSLTDQQFLVNWVDDDEGAETWLYVPVSESRLKMVRSGHLTLRYAFTHAEGLVYVVRLPHVLDASDEAHPAPPGSIRDEWLPDPNYRIDLATETLPPAVDGREVERLARQEGRARFRLRLHDPLRLRNEAATRQVGEILTATQGVFDNIGLAQLHTTPEQSGRIPNDVLARTSSDVLELSAASFVVELGAADGDDLFGESPFAKIAATLVSLMALDTPESELLSQLTELRPRGAKSFRAFVNELASTGADVSIAAAGAALPYREAERTAEQVTNLKELLGTVVPDETAEVRGRMRLYRFDMQRRLFGLVDLFNGEVYEGAIARRAMPQVDHAVSNEVYDVVITATTFFDQAIGERKPTYVLEQLTASETSVPVPAEFKRIDADGPAGIFDRP